jgi:DNA recombination protein RmuC
VHSYNKAAANLETRVLVTARKFRDLEADDQDKEIDSLADIEVVPRALQSPEFSGTTTIDAVGGGRIPESNV